MPRPRALRCPNCGAPLAWAAPARVVECAYCKTHIVTDTGSVTREPTNVVAKRPTSAAPLVGALAIAFILTGVVAVVVFTGGSAASGGPPARSVASLSTLDLARGPEAFARAAGAPLSGRSVRLRLSDAPFEEIIYDWAPEAADHVSSVRITLPKGSVMPAQVVERARGLFGHHLRSGGAGGGHTFSSKQSSLRIGDDLVVHTTLTAGWQARVQILVRALRVIAFGESGALQERERRDVLNIGYSLSDVAKVDPSVPVTAAAAEVARVAPGVDQSDARFTLGLDHPTFLSATLSWKNEDGGRLSGLWLALYDEAAYATLQPPLVTCVQKQRGAPEVSTSDALKGLKTYTWSAQGELPGVILTHQALSVGFWRGPPTAAAFRSAVELVERCR